MTAHSRSAAPVLLAHSYFLRYDDKQWRRMKPYPPLATLIVAASLRARGHDIVLFDAMLARGVNGFCETLDATRPAIVAIVEDNFNFLTKMCTTRMRDAAHRMIREAKARGCRVVVNGSDASDQAGAYLAAGADAVAIGEPEETVADVVEAWLGGASRLDRVRGLALPGPEGGPPRRTVHRPGLRELDRLPLPAWDLVDVERYRRSWHEAHGRLSWNVVTSRGCPYQCNWCAKPVFGSQYAQHSAERVAEEMARLKAEVRPDHVWFADDIFGLTERWILRFADEVERRDARIPFTMQSRVNLMKPNTVAALARAGAEEVWLGVESGSQAILDAMDKGTAIGQIRRATQTLQRAGVRSCWFIQLGYLGETWEDILATRDLIRDEWPDDIGVSVSYPLPGTRFHEMVKEQFGDKTHWDDSDDLAMMFAGTYTTEFYREIRVLLHDEVEAGRSGWAERRAGFARRWRDLAEREICSRSARPAVAS